MTYDDALKERTREILMILTGTHDKNRPLFPALIQKVAEISSPLRSKLRDMALEEEERWERRMFGQRSRSYSGFDWGKYVDKDGKEVDELDPEKLEEEDEPDDAEEERKEEQRGLARKANIAIRASEVGATTDRTWRGTKYVSRSGNSLWVRKELPKALQPFVRTQARPDMSTALKAISYEK